MKKLSGLFSLILLVIMVSMTVPAEEGKNAVPQETTELINQEGAKDMIPVMMQIGDSTFTVSMQDNDSTQALLARLPMTITMNEMNGNEKYFYLPSSLPADSKTVGTVHAGELMLYGSDCLVLFYKDFNTSYRYTKLGLISDTTGLLEALPDGDIEVTIWQNMQK